MEYRNKLKTLLFGRDMESMVCHGLRKCMKDFPQIEADYGKARENIIHQLGEEAQRLCQSVSDQVYAALFFAGVQGLRMNRDHFRNPLMPDCTWFTSLVIRVIMVEVPALSISVKLRSSI